MKNKKFILGVFLIIVFVAVVVGLNIYKASYDSNIKITEANIREIASSYASEEKNNVSWINNPEVVDGNNEYACVNLENLVNKKYIDGSNLINLDITNYVMVVRDNSKKIVSSEFVTDDVCRVDQKIKVPKASEICNNISYDGDMHNLINGTINHLGYSYVDRYESDALEYPVELSLQEYYVWDDGTHDDKEIVCSIKKSKIDLELSSYGNDSTVIGTKVIELNSNVSGSLLVDVNNSDNVSVDIGENKIEANVSKSIFINTISSSNETTTVTFTVVPSDDSSKNYDNTSITYTVGKENQKVVSIPTSESYCNNNLVYNQNLQILTKEADEGYRFINNEKISAGDYKVTAVLKYGYKWNDGTIGNKDLYCKINKMQPKVTVDYSDEKIIKEVESIFEISSDVKGNFEIMNNNIQLMDLGLFSVGYYNFYQLYLKGIDVSENNDVMIKFIPDDIKNYEEVSKTINLSVIDNEFTLNYDLNGGTGCGVGSKKIYYGMEYGELCVPSKEGYEFIGWYDSKDDRNNEITQNTILEVSEDTTIYAHFKKIVTLKLVQYEGSEMVTTEVVGEMYNNESGTKIMLPEALVYYDDECDGWNNLGWSIGVAADGNIDYKIGKEYLFNKDLTLYAKYVKKVSFVYDTDGGNKIEPRYENMYRNASGESSNLGNWVEFVDKIPSRSGYDFLGWYNDDDLEIGVGAIKRGNSAAIDFGCNGYEIIAKWSKSH